MWCDTHAKLAEIECRPDATDATVATPATDATHAPARLLSLQALQTRGPRKPDLRAVGVSTPPDPELIRDLLEERAAMREYDGGQTRVEAEAGVLGDIARSTGVECERLLRLWVIEGGRR